MSQVQEAIDPARGRHRLGLAPIGHVVTVEGVAGASIDVACSLTFDTGVTWDSAQEAVKAAIETYFADLISTWADAPTT